MIKAIYRNSSYYLGIANLVSNDVEVEAKFDTGAGSTIVTLGAIYDNYKDEWSETFIAHLKEKYDIATSIFTVASGMDIVAVKVYKNNVIVGDIHFDVFYYWLSPLSYSKVLLGDDFINNCSFIHNSHSDIIINAFDMAAYTEQHSNNSQKILSIDEITDILSVENSAISLTPCVNMNCF